MRGVIRTLGPSVPAHADTRQWIATVVSLLLIGLVILSATGCDTIFDSVDGSGDVVSESRDVAGFDQVVMEYSGEMEIIQGDAEGLTIETDDNLLQYIRTKVDNGTLTIDLTESKDLNPSKSIKYELLVQNLSRIESRGSLVARAQSLRTESLTVDISGSGEVTIGSLEAQELAVQVDGSGKLNLGGQVTTQRIDISGSGRYDAGGLASASAEISIDGSGNAVLQASDTLDISISGSGKVQYYGNPRIDQSISGSGSVESRGEPPS